MKRIRIAVLGLALVALSAVSAEAQQQQGGPGRMTPQARIARLLEGTTVDAATQAKIDSVIKVHEPALTKLREEMMAARQAGGDMAPIQTKSREVNTKLNDDIKKVLTPEQVKAFDANLEKQRQGGGRPNGL